jgi:hypothetical protein
MARPGDTRRERYPELDPTRPEPVPLGAGAVRFSSRAGRRPWTSRSIPAGKLSVATGSRLVLQPAQVADKPQALDRRPLRRPGGHHVLLGRSQLPWLVGTH